MKTKIFITLALILIFIFSLSLAVSTDAAPDAETSAMHADDTDTTVQSNAIFMPEEVTVSSAPKRNGNTPYFIGAGIAVLVFTGVALYCKNNGNKTL